MARKKSSTLPEELLLLPKPPSKLPIVDTHTHIAPTFLAYQAKYGSLKSKNGGNEGGEDAGKAAQYGTPSAFVRAMYAGRNVHAVVDVWCEPSGFLAPSPFTAPAAAQFEGGRAESARLEGGAIGAKAEDVANGAAEGSALPLWREFADAALTKKGRKRFWGGMEYWFVMGVHPNEAKNYTDEVENTIVSAMAHPRCVGWGEIGLDYHYTLSPRPTQQDVFARQLRMAVRLGRPITVHTREAEEDTERILKEEVPREWKIHIHCFTDSPAFAARLLAHFPNLYIGVTGVVTYKTNTDTAATIQDMVHSCSASSDSDSSLDQKSVGLCMKALIAFIKRKTGFRPKSSSAHPTLRILLETDAPYMIPSNLYLASPALRGKRLPLCHSAMVPWIAEHVAGVLGAAVGAETGREAAAHKWTADRVMAEARENAHKVYGI